MIIMTMVLMILMIMIIIAPTRARAPARALRTHCFVPMFKLPSDEVVPSH